MDYVGLFGDMRVGAVMYLHQGHKRIEPCMFNALRGVKKTLSLSPLAIRFFVSLFVSIFGVA